MIAKPIFPTIYGLVALFVLAANPAVSIAQQLDENCTVSILNRTARVQPDGTWQIDNVPANFEQVRVRVTCVRDGVTTSGQSDFISFEPGITNGFSPLLLGAPVPIPERLEVSIPGLPLAAEGATAQLAVTAHYPGGATADVTGAESGINYRSSNPALASVTAGGVVTAHLSGTVLITALLEGALAVQQVQVVLGGDKDGDGIADDLELANGLNPCDGVDGMEDEDEDGLTNKQELVDFGTDLRLADTDGDSINDREETESGADGFITNPLLADSDGDLVPDALEIAQGTDPTDALSVNFSGAVASFAVSPGSVLLTVNSVTSEASRQLAVSATLTDGTVVDLTSTSRGTNYASSDLTVVNFGSPDGRIFAGDAGSAAVTVSNGAFSQVVPVTVTGFSPTPLGFVAIPGYANNVDVANDSVAYVAAGAAGLQVVDVNDPRAPAIIGALDTPGNANDVRVVGNIAYIADGSAGLQVIDVSDPADPRLLGSFDTPGSAQDVRVANGIAYIADGTAGGLQIIDISNPAAPRRIGSIDTEGDARGVDLSGQLAVVAEESPFPGLRVIDVSDPRQPVVLGSITISGGPKDVAVEGDYAYVAAYTGGFNVVDISDPTLPAVVGLIPGGGSGFVSRDVALSDRFALAAEQLFADLVNPIVDISDPTNPIFRTNLVYPRAEFGDYAGTGIALTREFVYVTAESFVVGPEFGTSGNTRLFIGQYRSIEDNEGVAPQVAILSPDGSVPFIEGQTLTVVVDATDDVAVANVTLLGAGGVTVGADSSEPFEFSYTLPVGVSSTTIQAVAIDFGGNSAQTEVLPIQIIPDPGTTVVGRVLDNDGAPVGGATVAVFSTFTTTSAADGRFTLNGIPTVRGNVVATARIEINGDPLSGVSSAVAPVRNGTTDVGDFRVSRALFELEIGSALQSCDDCFEEVPLPFTFTYFGIAYDRVFMDGNGRLRFDSGSSAFTENLRGFLEQPTIAAFWDDLDGRGIDGGGFYFNSSIPGQAVFTWWRVKEFGESPQELNHIQIILFEDGRIQFGYAGMTAPDAIVGITPGPDAPVEAISYDAVQGGSWPVPTSVYEQFTGSNPFDLDRTFVVWRPNGAGYDLSRLSGDGGTIGNLPLGNPVITVAGGAPLADGALDILGNDETGLANEVTMVFQAVAGRSYRIERSKDLLNWIRIGQDFQGSELLQIFLREPPTNGRCFYRILELEGGQD